MISIFYALFIRGVFTRWTEEWLDRLGVIVFGRLFGKWVFLTQAGFNIHRAVECISINFIIAVLDLKQNQRHSHQLQVIMSAVSSDENEDNQFIKNFDKKFITIPKNTDTLKRLNQNNISIDFHDAGLILSDNHMNTPNDILEQSRGKVMNSHSMKSLNSHNLESHNLGQSTSIERLKAKKEKAESILKNRFAEYKQKLSKSINKLESICQQNFGGLHNINQQLNKHQLSRQQLVQYYAKMLPPHSDLPRILQKYKSPTIHSQKLPKLRSLSQKRIPFFGSQQQKKQKKQLKHNKWYIEPQKRFSISNDKTLHDWRTEEGIRNVIRTEELRIKSKQIGNLIKEVKQKFNREPVFCKYVRIA